LVIDANISHSVVIMGWYLPYLYYLDKNVSSNRDYRIILENGVWNLERDISYRYLLPLDELKDLQNKGYVIYYIRDIHLHTQLIYGYDLNDYNCLYLGQG